MFRLKFVQNKTENCEVYTRTVRLVGIIMNLNIYNFQITYNKIKCNSCEEGELYQILSKDIILDKLNYLNISFIRKNILNSQENIDSYLTLIHVSKNSRRETCDE
jgi:hypothetical protein